MAQTKRERTTQEQNFLVDWLRSTDTRLKQGADDGILRIVEYGLKNNYRIAEIAYNLATAGHETAYWYQPIREGATRSGPIFTDAQARSAVRNAIDRGIIKRDYVTPINGRSYYGRGLVQITWLDNYRKYEQLIGKPLVSNPDLVLDWDISLFILFDGVNKGRFRKVKFADFVPVGTEPTHQRMSMARDIVNGDTKREGDRIGRLAMDFYTVLLRHEPALKAQYTQKQSLVSYILSFLKGGTK